MELTNWLNDQGFELKVLMHKDETNVIKEIKDKDVELIIIDYKLSKRNGDVLIDEIRQSGCYQDIIFYSQEKLPEKRYDGVFYVSKGDAKTRIKELIELKLKRSSDLVSVRGWIVADAIELEGMVTDLLLQCFTQKKGLTFTERLLGQESHLELGAKYIILSGVIKDLIVSLQGQETKNKKKIEQLSQCKVVFSKFPDEVIEVRNAIAHQKVEEVKTGKIIKKRTKKGDEIHLNETTYIQIRKDLRKHQDNLITLQSLI
jgi:CheY-like chemotaxis protein